MSDFVNGWCPTPPASRSQTWRLNVAQFGDGYSQRMLDGINALDRTWHVEFANRFVEDVTAMDTYLTAMGAHSFPFKDPGTGMVWDVFCDEWSVDWTTVLFRSDGTRTVLGTLSADFKKANGLGVA